MTIIQSLVDHLSILVGGMKKVSPLRPGGLTSCQPWDE